MKSLGALTAPLVWAITPATTAVLPRQAESDPPGDIAADNFCFPPFIPVDGIELAKDGTGSNAEDCRGLSREMRPSNSSFNVDLPAGADREALHWIAEKLSCGFAIKPSYDNNSTKIWLNRDDVADAIDRSLEQPPVRDCIANSTALDECRVRAHGKSDCFLLKKEGNTRRHIVDWVIGPTGETGNGAGENGTRHHARPRRAHVRHGPGKVWA